MTARTATVRCTVENPGPGNALAGKKASIRLNVDPAYTLDGTRMKTRTTWSDPADSTGMWSAVLEINDDIDPPGTCYSVQFPAGTGKTQYFQLLAAHAGLVVDLRPLLREDPTNPNPLSAAVTHADLDAEIARATSAEAGAVRKNAQVIDLRDWGVVGDGVSRPLSTLYGTLTAARAVYPAALALTDEVDWAAFASALAANPTSDVLVAGGLNVITNRPLDPKPHTRWSGKGTITNIYDRTLTASDDKAAVLRWGNMHPVVLNTTSADAWPVRALAAVNAGDMTVTIPTPAGLTLTAGDFLFVRCDNHYDVSGAVGRQYDYMQLNKVKAYNSSAGVVTLEMPVRVTMPVGTPITSGAAAGTAAAPTLAAGTTNATGGIFGDPGGPPTGTVGWKVAAVNPSGESLASARVTVIIDTRNTQVLTWTAGAAGSGGATTGYNVYRQETNGAWTLVAKLGNVLTYTDIGWSLLCRPMIATNNGLTDSSNGNLWWVLDDFEIDGIKLVGKTPFDYKMGAWNCRAKFRSDCTELVNTQCMVKSQINVTGEFSNRALEVKFASVDNDIYLHGVYKYDPNVPSPQTTISIGEQSAGNRVRGYVHRGNQFPANVRMLEEYAQGTDIDLTLHDYSPAGQVELAAIKSTGMMSRPPSDCRMKLSGTTTPGKTSYVLVGNDASGDGVANDADPTRVLLDLNLRTPDGTPPTYLAKSVRGSLLRVATRASDVYTSVMITPAEPFEGPAPFALAQVTTASLPALGGGGNGIAAGTTKLVATATVIGCKLGDQFQVTWQALNGPVGATIGDLYVTSVVSATNTVKVLMTNISATDATFSAGLAAFNVLATWQRGRN